MGTSTLWMNSTLVLLASVVLATAEETMRRRAACLRFQHELRRGAYHPVRQAAPGRHLSLVEPRHRKAA